MMNKTIVQPTYCQSTNSVQTHHQQLLGKQSSGLFKQTLAQRLIRFALISLLAPLSIMPAMAGDPAMAADIEAANNDTAVNESANGVPIIDIARPNDAGISHNIYQQFTVGEQGAVLNNSTALQTETALAGSIASNPNLTGPAAELIINEVVSSNRSVLNGSLEVAGQAAHVMVANPYGITCDGCGFINTPDVMLTTGSAQFDNAGRFEGLNMMSPHKVQDFSGDEIRIQNKGITLPEDSNLVLQARKIFIGDNSEAWLKAKNLQLITMDDAADTRSPVEWAIDVSSWGGLAADSIKLISNQMGAGVNLNTLHIKANNVALNTQGQITFTKAEVNAEKEINISGNGLSLTKTDLIGSNVKGITLNSNQGEISTTASKMIAEDGDLFIGAAKDVKLETTYSSGQSIELKSGGNISVVQSPLHATKDLRVNAEGNVSLTETSLIAEEIMSAVQSPLQDTHHVHINANDISITGTELSSQDIYFTSRGNVNMDKITLKASDDLKINADKDIRMINTAAFGNTLSFNSGGTISSKIAD